MKIGIIIGSVRDGRKGQHVADWVAAAAQDREVDYELVDLKAFDLPVLTWERVPGSANKQYPLDSVKAWSAALEAYDGYVVVTPEYNHSVPGGLKNAVDWIYPELAGKAAALVSYGAESGVRAVEHWRQIFANFSMLVVRAQVSMSTFLEWDEGEFSPHPRRPQELQSLFDQLEAAVRRQQS